MFSPIGSFSSFSNRGKGMLLTLLILGCFCLYCWYLWLGEFKGENKSAYTLLTLPLPKKFIIIYKFLAKMFLLFIFSFLSNSSITYKLYNI